MTFGLSPVSLALAMLDWGAHLAVSPGKCFELATQAWLASASSVAEPGAADDADADSLAVPDIEAGNLLAKQLEYLGGAVSAGIVVGARVPIVLTSRADSVAVRVASCALAMVPAQVRHAPPS